MKKMACSPFYKYNTNEKTKIKTWHARHFKNKEHEEKKVKKKKV